MFVLYNKNGIFSAVILDIMIFMDVYFRDPKKKLTISYPCVMLNVDVARNNTNDQYQVGGDSHPVLCLFHFQMVFA